MLIKKSYLFFAMAVVGFFFLSEVTSCTHDDDPLAQIPDSTFEYGDDLVYVSDGYNFDKTHSSVRWETAYLGSAALLTGRFNQFEMSIEFDESNPENTSLFGKVTLSTVNTGEPGRDQGCLLGTFDVATSDEATFTSTSVTADNKGAFNVEGTMEFHGVTAPITGKLIYVGTTHFDENSGQRGAPLNVAGFIVEFEFAAKSVFGIESGNISDNVKVIASGQFKQPLG